MELPAETVNRVARAICESLESDKYDELSEGSIVKAAYLQQAAAAIEAMNVPALLLAERLSATERAAKIAENFSAQYVADIIRSQP